MSEVCEWCGETPAAGSQRELHDELPDEVDADVLCTSCILDDIEGEFADARDVMADGGTATETCTESRRDYPPCERCGDRTWFAKKSLTYPSRSHHAVEHVCGLCYALCHRQRWFTDPDGHSQKVPGAWDGDAPAVENQRAVALAARTEAETGEVQPRETPAGRRVTGR